MLGTIKINFKQLEMTTLRINKNGNIADILIQNFTIGGTITDAKGNKTAIVTFKTDLNGFFDKVETKTGIKFFNL